MTRIRIVEGKTTIITKGNHYMYSEGDITFKADGFINETAERYKYSDEPIKSSIFALETITELDGYFYSSEGVYLGKIGTGNNVYITDQTTFLEVKKGKTADDKIVRFTEKYGLNNTQVLDRANWIYAEGKGSVPFYYAYCLANSRKINSEAKIYYYGMQEMQNGKVVHLDKDKYLSGTGTSQNKDNACAFWKTRNKPEERTSSIEACISAVILSVMNPDKDPTKGCTGWLGYGDSGHQGAFQFKVLGRYHIFRIVGKKYVTAILKTSKDYENETKNIK